MIAERKIKERAAAQAARAKASPSVTASRVNGGVKVVVAHPTAEIKAVLDEHGFALEIDLSNTYSRVCSTPADLTVVQGALRGFFGR